MLFCWRSGVTSLRPSLLVIPARAAKTSHDRDSFLNANSLEGTMIRRGSCRELIPTTESREGKSKNLQQPECG